MGVSVFVTMIEPSNQNATSQYNSNMLEDAVCEALGVSKDGRCLLHPNICVAVVSTASGDTDKVEVDGDAAVVDVTGGGKSSDNRIAGTSCVHVKECLICRSEIDGGGIRQRRSMAYAIKSVQDLHANEEEWTSFKQNWETDQSDDKDSQSSPDTKKEGEEEEDDALHHKAGSDADKATGSVGEENNFRLALLRASQVQKWKILEKDKEILRLQQKLEEAELANQEIQKEFETQKANLVNQITDLESKVKIQEKAINDELVMIKSIATKRADARSHTKTVTSNVLSSPNGKVNHAFHDEASPPQMPARKASAVVGSTSDTTGADIPPIRSPLVKSRRKDQHPTLPVRQASDQHLINQGIAAQNFSSAIHIKYPLDRDISFNNHRNNVAPSLPLRQPSRDTCLTNTFSDMTLSMATGTEYSAASSSDHFARSEVTMDTINDEIKHVTRSSAPKDSRLSHEISFVPTEMEVLVDPPQFSSQSPESTMTKHTHEKRDMKAMSSSQEIEFDARVAFDTAENTARKHSVKEMKFNEQLLMEASQAFSVSSLPVPPKQKKAETVSNSSTSKISSSDDEKKEIVFNGSPESSSRKEPHNGGIYKPIQTTTSGREMFGNAAVATEEDEEDDEYDYFDSLPGGLQVGNDRFLECHRSANNISPVSALTTGSYLYDANLNGGDDEDEIEPMKGLHQGGATKQLPMEANFDSEDEDQNDDKPPTKKKSKAGLAAQLKQIDSRPSPKKTPASKMSRKTVFVEKSVVNDKYGDSGTYTGLVLVDKRLPHGEGHMKYENGREYKGDWRGGRWHGSGR